jgi:hypothetical protein
MPSPIGRNRERLRARAALAIATRRANAGDGEALAALPHRQADYWTLAVIDLADSHRWTTETYRAVSQALAGRAVTR